MVVKFLEEEREWILSNFLYADDLVLCGESEEDLKRDWTKCQSSNIWVVFWMNRVQMLPTAVGR